MSIEIRSRVKSEFVSWRLNISDILTLTLELADGSSLVLDDTAAVSTLGLACEEYLARLSERDADKAAERARFTEWAQVKGWSDIFVGEK